MNTLDAHPDSTDPGIERSLRRYRALLVAYPRSFREEYGEDLVQAFRDLLVLRAETRGLWWRTTRDLAVSASRERVIDARGSIQGSVPMALGLVALIAVSVMLGSANGLMVTGALALAAVVPVAAVVGLRGAWVRRRTTGAPVGGTVAVSIAGLVTSGAFYAAVGDSRGWLAFMAVSSTLVIGSLGGIVWAVSATVHARRHTEAPRPHRRALLAGVAGVVVLAFIAGASYNSYRKSLGPAGDHSVANASADTRALWDAADRGDVAEVRRLSATCADPWVKFPVGNGRHNAKGWVEEKTYGMSSIQKAPYMAIREILRDTMDTWADRCG